MDRLTPKPQAKFHYCGTEIFWDTGGWKICNPCFYFGRHTYFSIQDVLNSNRNDIHKQCAFRYNANAFHFRQFGLLADLIWSCDSPPHILRNIPSIAFFSWCSAGAIDAKALHNLMFCKQKSLGIQPSVPPPLKGVMIPF